jgi:hypothetical protein
MKCPQKGCSGRLCVLESRERRGRVHRRHLCNGCGYRCQSVQELVTPQALAELARFPSPEPPPKARPRMDLPADEVTRVGILVDLVKGVSTADIVRRYGVAPTQIAALQYAFKTANPDGADLGI